MRPNVLFIIADDLNSWISPLGRQPDARTPSIAALGSSDDLMGAVMLRATFT